MQRIAKIGLGVSLVLGLGLAAGTAGAGYSERTYEQCLIDGQAECQNEVLNNPNGDKFQYATCLAAFHENCRIHYGVP